MAQPTSRDLRPIDPLLTNMSIGFRNDRFFYENIAPIQTVQQPSGQFTVWESEYWFRRQEGADRGSQAPYVRVGYEVGYDSFRVSEIGFEKLLSEVDIAASQLPENLEAQDIAFLTNLMQMELEGRVADNLFKTGVWGTDRTGVASADDDTTGEFTHWDDYTNSTPIEDVRTARQHIHQMTGAMPNNMFIGLDTWNALQYHPDITEKYKYTTVGIMTPDLVKAVLEIPNLYIGDSIQVTSPENRAASPTVTRTKVWKDNALIQVSNTPQLGVANGAYMFMWDEKGNVPWAIENYYEPSVRSIVNRVFTHMVPKVVSKEHGYFFSNCHS